MVPADVLVCAIGVMSPAAARMGRDIVNPRRRGSPGGRDTARFDDQYANVFYPPGGTPRQPC